MDAPRWGAIYYGQLPFAALSRQALVLLALVSEEPDMQYVLYSPPDAEGNPTNTAFHRADFSFVSEEPTGSYGISGYVPNPLKTGSTSQYKGHSDYQYFLFGGSDVPHLVYEGFSRAGFEFCPQPYCDDIGAPEGTVTKFTLGAHEGAARKLLGYRGMHYWPGDQFAEQVRNLGLEVPKLSPEDYPLVKPENSLQK